MAGIKALRKIQLGREITPGTAVAATTLFRGMGSMADDREATFVEEQVGMLVRPHRSHISKFLGAISFESTPATFQQFQHFCEAGIASVAPANDGVGSGKIYTYPFPTTSLPTLKTYTIEAGNNQQAEEMEYSYCKAFALEGSGGEALMMSGDWEGRQVTNAAFTGAIAVPTVEDILFSKGKVYINNVSSAFGTTLVSNSILSMAFNYASGIIPKFTADGQLYFSFAQMTQPEITLDITFEHDANAVAEKTAWRAQTPRAIQLKFEGSGLTTPGTTYSLYTLILNLAGKWETFEPISDTDGNDTVTGKFRVGYDSTLATAGNIIVVNELASVP